MTSSMTLTALPGLPLVRPGDDLAGLIQAGLQGAGAGGGEGDGLGGGRTDVSGEGEGGEWVLLLPENPDASARRLRQGLESWSGKQLGVLIIDSHGRAWRMGTVGVAIGVSGFPALGGLRGRAHLSPCAF